MPEVLFLGNFLAKSRGTVGPSEKVVNLLSQEGYAVESSSSRENQLFRLIDITVVTAFRRFKIAHIDIFSGLYFVLAEIATFIVHNRKKKLLITLHGGKLPEFYRQNPKRVEGLFRKADRILTPSLYLQKFFQDKGFTIDYLSNSIDLSRFPYAVERSKQAKLLWVRAFSPIYHPSLAVETLFHVRKQIPSATLTMVGPDKGELNKVKDLIKALHLEEAIEVTGPVPNEALYQYYHSHSVFLNTTAYESFGVAVMEAAACGIPILSTKVGELPYLWENEEELLLVETPGAEAFAHHAVRILSNDELANRLSVNARKKAERFDWERIKQKWIKILTE